MVDYGGEVVVCDGQREGKEKRILGFLDLGFTMCFSLHATFRLWQQNNQRASPSPPLCSTGLTKGKGLWASSFGPSNPSAS